MEIDGMGADAERRSRRAVIALALGTGGAAFVAASSETAASTAIVPGPTGPAGATGPIGATGPRGATGATGAVGARGAPGRDGVGATGAAGPPGATGVSGHAGMQGIPGTAGTAGVMGPAHVQFIYRQRSDTIPAGQASHTASYACDTGEQAIGARYGGLPSGWRVNLAGLGHPIDPTLADTYTMSAVGYSRDADSELFVYLTCMQIQTI